MKSSNTIQRKALYKNKDFCIEENLMKNFIQRTLYRYSKVRGSALIVSGPAIQRHLNDYDNFICPYTKISKVIIAENDKDVLNNILSVWGDIYKNYKFKTAIFYGGVETYPLNGIRFVDADLTATFSNTKPIFKKLYNDLSSKNMNKSLICTYSIARREENLSISYNISQIIGEAPVLIGKPISLDPIGQKKGGNDFIHMFNYQCKGHDILAFEYRQNSGAIMVSFIINW